MQKITLILSLLLFITMGNSAQDKIKWGPKTDESGVFTLVGQSDDIIYVSGTKVTKMGFGWEQKLFGFDKNLQLKNEIDFKKSFGKTNMCIDMFAGDQLDLLSYNIKSKKKPKLQLHTIENGKIKFVKDCTTLNNEYQFLPNGINNIPFGIDNKLKLYSSSNSDFRAISLDQKIKKKKRKVIIEVLNAANQYSQAYSIRLDFDNSKRMKLIEDVILSKNGRTSVIIKEYYSKKEKEKKDNKPNYEYHIETYDSNGEVYSSTITPNEGFYKSLSATADEEGNIYMSILIEDKHDKGAQHIGFKKIDLNGQVSVDKKFVPKSLIEGKDKLDKYTYSSNLIHCSNDMIISTSFNTNTKSKGFVITTSSDEVEFKDVIIDGFDSEGNYLWSERVSRDMRVPMLSFLNSTHILYNNESAMLFMNRHKDNASKTFIKKPKKAKLPNKKNTIAGITFNKDGLVEAKALTVPSDVHIGAHGIRSIDGEVYFVGFDKRYKNLRLGVLQQ